MGRKDAAKIAQQLIEYSPNQTAETPVHILEAVSTQHERLWSSTLAELANGKANDWFDAQSPALIMIGQALRNTKLKSSSSEVDNSLQDCSILTNSKRSA